MIFETRCAGCDTLGSAAICTTCRFALLGRAPSRQADDVIVAVPFTGRARAVVVGMKYRNRRAVGRHLAGLMVNRLLESGAAADLDMVTWAPTSGARRRARGFDQAELIARTVARQLGLPCRRLLERADRSGVGQTGRSRAERLVGPAFRARPGIDGRHVLVVDDVVTTGATLASAGSALEARRATVTLAAVAATPTQRSAEVVRLPARRGAAAAA